jgi:hypothetical protein
VASLAAEKNQILTLVARALGEEGERDVRLALSHPPLENQLPHHFGAVESLELHLGLAFDRTKGPGKQSTVDLYLPGRDLYFELDRDGHDFSAPRAVSLQYYPPGLPRGFRSEHYRQLITALRDPRKAEPPGMGKMNASRALVDFAKDLYIEGELGKVLVRLPKPELTFLLDRSPVETKLERLRQYLSDLARALALPALEP